MITTKQIVKEYLEKNGYDGLYSEECVCLIKDLAPCCEDFMDCLAGYKTSCNPETCPADGDCDWHVGPRKDKP